MLYVCIAMAIQWIFNIYKSVALDMIRWNEVYLPEKIPVIKPEAPKEEEPEVVQ